MDWSTFFKDYGQSLFTLGGVLLGSLITFLINYLNLRYQSREREEDRQEQRREAKTELALELMRDDIKLVEASIDNKLKILDIIGIMASRYAANQISEEELGQQLISFIFDEGSKYKILSESFPIARKIASSLGKEFSLEYGRFDREFNDVIAIVLQSPTNTFHNTRNQAFYAKAMETAATLHAKLKDILISIRDN